LSPSYLGLDIWREQPSPARQYINLAHGVASTHSSMSAGRSPTPVSSTSILTTAILSRRLGKAG
jgi:hypothetical protein